MTETKVSSKTPATTAKKGKGEKERDVITRIKDLLPQWEIQKVEAFCAEHGHDLEKIHAALDSSYERTGHQPDDWQVMTKKEQKPKRGGFRSDGGSREPRESPRPREDRPRSERGGRGRGAESSRGGGRGRGGGDRRGGRGGAGAGANRSKESNGSNPAVTDLSSISLDNAPSTTETWGADSAQDSKPESTTAEWGASSSPVASTPLAVASVAPVASSRAVEEKKMSWAQKASAGAAKKAQLNELQSAEAFPLQQSQQILGPAVVHVQPAIPAGPSYRAALQGNSRWGPKKPDAVVEQTDTSMVPLEQQTSAMTIDAYQPSDTYASGQVDDNNSSNGPPQDNNDVATTSSDVLNSISDIQQDQVTSSFPQAEAFQPESSFQQPQQTDNSFQIYQASQNQQPSSVPEQQTSQSTVYSQTVSSPSGFDDIRSPQTFSQDNNNSGKTVIDLLAAANSVILPHVEPPASFGIEFGTFGQAPSTVYASSAQPEPVQQQPEVQPVAVAQQQALTEQNTPTETQQQLPQSFVSTLREDSLPAKQASDNSGSQFSAQNQFYQGQSQPQSVPPPSQPQSQSQSQPASYRGPSGGSYDPHYAGGYPFPGYENSSPYYDFAARDNQQSYQPNYDYSAQFRGGATGGGSRRPAANTNAPYYPSPTTRGPTDGSSGNASPPTSEPVSPKSASFSKPASFAPNKQSFSSNTTKISPQIPTYSGKPAGVPPNAGYSKPPAVATQPSQKSFKPPSQPQGAQSQHHPDPQHYMYPPAGVYGAYPYPYPYQAPGQPMPPGFMHPQMPYAPYDPRYSYAYPSPVQSFEGDYEQYPKPGAHYSEGGTTPRGATEWNGQNADGQQKPSNASAPANAPSSANAIPSSMNSAKNTVAPGANKKRFEYEDPHYNSGYGFAGAPASSPMAMHAAAAPYQPANYGQPILHAMGGQAPYGGGQYEAHPRGYTGGSWQ